MKISMGSSKNQAKKEKGDKLFRPFFYATLILTEIHINDKIKSIRNLGQY